jgi:hypothetical protein
LASAAAAADGFGSSAPGVGVGCCARAPAAPKTPPSKSAAAVSRSARRALGIFAFVSLLSKIDVCLSV